MIIDIIYITAPLPVPPLIFAANCCSWRSAHSSCHVLLLYLLMFVRTLSRVNIGNGTMPSRHENELYLKLTILFWSFCLSSLCLPLSRKASAGFVLGNYSVLSHSFPCVYSDRLTHSIFFSSVWAVIAFTKAHWR